MASQHPLQNTWVFWIQDLTSNPNTWKVQEICEFSSVEEFWRQFGVVPKPSHLFYDGRNRKLLDGKEIESLAIFRKNIYPGWEDEINANGSELLYRKVNMNVDILDMYWENTVLALIGETVDMGEGIICGCRVVDKSKAKSTNRVYRLEVWLSTANQTIGDEYCKRLIDIIQDEGVTDTSNKRKGQAIDFEWRRHTHT